MSNLNRPHITILHLAALRTFLAWLATEPKNVVLLEGLGDTKLDYSTLDLSHPSIEIEMEKDNPNNFFALNFAMGRWVFKVILSEYPSWKQRYGNYGPDDVALTIAPTYDGQWTGSSELTYNIGTDKIALEPIYSLGIVDKFVKPIRTRVAAVVRGYDAYLKDVPRYDNLRQLLKIKTKKKK